MQANTYFQLGLFVVVSTLFFFTGCTPTTSRIEPPVKEADILFSEYKIDPAIPHSLKRPTGTLIKIPPYAFYDQQGVCIEKPVKLLVREFHSAYDLVRAGIPMRVNGNDKEVLQSAGMIELRAFEGDKPLDLGNQNTIEVHLAGFRSSDGYRFYYLENDHHWIIPDTFVSGNNIEKFQNLDSIQKKIHGQCYPTVSPNAMIFELGGYRRPNDILDSFKDLKWMVCPEQSGPEPEKAMREMWESVKVIPPTNGDLFYTLRFWRKVQYIRFKPVNRNYEFKALPLSADGKPIYDHASIKKRIQQLDKQTRQLEKESERIRLEADVLNSFAINRLGVFNIDKPINNEETIFAKISFDFENEADHQSKNYTLIVVHEELNSCVTYPHGNWQRVMLSNQSANTILVVLPEGKMAVVHPSQIEEALAIGKSIMRFSTQRVDAIEYLKSKQGVLAGS